MKPYKSKKKSSTDLLCVMKTHLQNIFPKSGKKARLNTPFELIAKQKYKVNTSTQEHEMKKYRNSREKDDQVKKEYKNGNNRTQKKKFNQQANFSETHAILQGSQRRTDTMETSVGIMENSE